MKLQEAKDRLKEKAKVRNKNLMVLNKGDKREPSLQDSTAHNTTFRHTQARHTPAYIQHPAHTHERLTHHRCLRLECTIGGSTWYNLVHALATHMVKRHGLAEVSTWHWEVWSEHAITLTFAP